jgi:SpoVK/Ycf46/Vps4 family AAA+-type ATPase
MREIKQTVLNKVIEICKIAFSSKIPIIYLLTDEFSLVDEIIKSQELVELLEANNANKGVVPLEDIDNWKEAVNYKQNIGVFTEILSKYNMPKVFVVYNYHLYKENDKTINEYVHRYINAKGDSFIKNSLLILTSPILKLPEGLEPYIEVIDVPHLEEFEIEDIIINFVKGREEKPVKEYMGKIVDSFKGFSKSKIIEILKKIVAQTDYLSNNLKTIGRDKQPETVAFEIIKKEKEQMLKKSGNLSIVKTDDVSVGGLSGLIKWIESNKIILDNLNEARNHWNIEFSKGVLVSGIPGCGKSLMAKKTARIFNVPLIKMDMGALMGAHIGESENNMRMALKMAEAMAPCVLWIDELEKSFAGVGGTGEGDSGTLKRSFASFLTWMQDNEASCFIFATANDVSKLPPEFLRRGRFDQKFYVYMPMRIECIEIFKAILDKMNKSKDEDDSISLFESSILQDRFLGEIVDSCIDGADKKKFLTGADIEGIINDAVKSIFLEKYSKTINTSYKITKDEMKGALLKAIDCTKTYGENNLADIAACWIMIYENKFNPASGEEKDRVLFEFADFDKERENAIEKEKGEDLSLYDSVLFGTLKNEINSQMKYIKELKK